MPGWLWAVAGAALGSSLTLAAVLAWSPEAPSDALARLLLSSLRQ